MASTYSIFWGDTSYKDLRKPFYSALAASLVLEYLKKKKSKVTPSANGEQANFWKDSIKEGKGKTADFYSGVSLIPKGSPHLCSIDYGV